MRDIRIRFVYKHNTDGKILISAGYTLEDLISYYSLEEVYYNTCKCNCEPVGETNVVECNCSEYYDKFELVGRQQSTGLEDKKGEPIYEGDIVQLVDEDPMGDIEFEYKGQVEMNEGSWTVASSYTSYLLWQEVIEWEVIGNIYDNAKDL